MESVATTEDVQVTTPGHLNVQPMLADLVSKCLKYNK